MILLNIRELFYSYPGEKTTYLLDLPVFDDNDFSIVPMPQFLKEIVNKQD